MKIYLDNAATTQPCEAAVSACFNSITENYGNPSSLHGMGLEAEKVVTEARKSIAAALVCAPECITFTSGATESNNTAILGAAEKWGKKKRRVVISAVEHPSVAAPVKYLEAHGFEAVRVQPMRDGSIAPEDLINAVDESTFFVSCMLVNNETGAINPVRKMFTEIKRRFPQCITHCDAVQGFLKVPIKVTGAGVDLLTVSAHKVHGIKGAGAIYVRKGLTLPPLVYGGGQEKNFRSGTEAVPAIAAFGAAARALMPTMRSARENADKLGAFLREKLSELDFVTVNSTAENNSPYIINFSVEGIRSEIMLHFLESKDIYVSSGSACSKGAHSSVLTAMGIPDRTADSAIRVSISRRTQKWELEALIDGIVEGHDTLAKQK